MSLVVARHWPLPPQTGSPKGLVLASNLVCGGGGRRGTIITEISPSSSLSSKREKLRRFEKNPNGGGPIANHL
ncbi:hypothetical protein CRG98_006345 [Punica granatum]|uniref:Uncharacterized protein n=1 Tax=Punica granatum TaxID=22663 RepID=A0A2I0KXR3_PUNGR|nr:hypothetical protein CRG98_006345 [Punica granatum]